MGLLIKLNSRHFYLLFDIVRVRWRIPATWVVFLFSKYGGLAEYRAIGLRVWLCLIHSVQSVIVLANSVESAFYDTCMYTVSEKKCQRIIGSNFVNCWLIFTDTLT